MTRKDYIAVARILREAHEHVGTMGDVSADGREREARRSMANDIAEEFAIYFAADNPRFDEAHFLAVVRGERDLNSRPKRLCTWCRGVKHDPDEGTDRECPKCGGTGRAA